MNPCPTCGGDKKDHFPKTWDVHLKMYKEYIKQRREFERYARRAQQKRLARISK